MKKEGDREILKITDFGISKFLKITESLNMLAGTKSAYMSPQVYNRQNYTHKADIWSLGVLFLEIITRNVKGLLPKDTTNFIEMDKDKIPKFIEKIPGERLSNDINDFLKFIREKMVVREEKKRVSLKELIYDKLFKKHYEKCKVQNLTIPYRKAEKKVTKTEVI